MSHKQTEGKLRLDLVPAHTAESIAKVREAAGTKYPDSWGWLVNVPPKEFIVAAERHLHKIKKADYNLEAVDEEFGLMHIEHALTSLSMALEIIKRDITEKEL